MSPIDIPTVHIRQHAARLLRPDSSQSVLYVLLALALVRGLLYAVLSPPFDGPDESEHLKYVAYLATSGASGPIGLEGYQPIGYYVLMVPPYLLVLGQPPAIQMYAVRIASILFLLGTVLFTWLAARKMSPGTTFLPVVATGFVALHPALAYFNGSVNNGNAASLMGAVLAYLVVLLLSGEVRRWFAPVAAAAIGAAIITKGSILPIVAISATVLTLRIVLSMLYRSLGKLLISVVAPVIVATVLLSGRAGERIRQLSVETASLLLNWPTTWEMVQESNPQQALYVQFVTFWTAYLAGAVRPASEWYYIPTAVILLAAAGYGLGLPARRLRPSISAVLLRVALGCMLIGVWLTASLVFVRFKVSADSILMDLIHGRYLFPAITPLALLIGEGWSLLTPIRVRALAGLAILALLAAFDVASFATLIGTYTWR